MDEKVERERDKGGEMEGTKMEMCGKDTKEEEEDEDEDEERGKLPGFRFHPTDEELVSFYLKRKVEGRPVEVIGHIDIYKYDPWDLPKVSNVGEKEWYFFCKRGRKYRNSIRPNRVTGSGFWKATGIDKPIHSAEEPRECIGLKKSLVYYRGNAGKGSKTDWMMHEFRLPPTIKNDTTSLGPHSKDIAQEAEVWTICRIFKRIPSHKKYTPHSKKHGANTDPVKCSNPADSYSIASSGFESEHSCEQYMSFEDSVTIHPKTESNMLGMDSAFVDDRDSLFLTDHFNSITAHHQPPLSGSWNLNGDGRVSYRNNWDELRSVVEQGIHHRSHDFDCT